MCLVRIKNDGERKALFFLDEVLEDKLAWGLNPEKLFETFVDSILQQIHQLGIEVVVNIVDVENFDIR